MKFYNLSSNIKKNKEEVQDVEVSFYCFDEILEALYKEQLFRLEQDGVEVGLDG